jgi:hypothetical protein
VLTSDGQQAVEHARAIYVSALQQTLGAHLSTGELDELGRITNKLFDALADRDPRCQRHPRR